MEVERLGRLGVWSWIDNFAADEAADFAGRLERWGYSALWIPEAVGRNPFAFLGYLAAHTEKLVLATGIANIYARDPMTMRAAHQTLSEVAPARFVLGIGVLSFSLCLFLRGPSRIQPPEFIAVALRFIGRHTLEIYAIQLAGSELLIKWIPNLAA